MKGVLLDTNHVWAYADERPAFMARLKKRPMDQLPRVCTVTLGELECGHLVTTSNQPDRRAAHRRFIIEKLHPFAWKIKIQHALRYAEIISRICSKRSKPSSKTLKDFLRDNQVDVNDVWIVAVALEHNLTVLTTDKMTAIREAVDPDVEFDNWTL